jgi:hypothetical protein
MEENMVDSHIVIRQTIGKFTAQPRNNKIEQKRVRFEHVTPAY